MSRQDDVIQAFIAMDNWAALHGLPEGGEYTGEWYRIGYMNGWFPHGRKYWLADYSKQPSVTVDQPIHQYTSNPIDTNLVHESEIINRQQQEEEEVVHPIPQQYLDNGWNTWYDVAVNLQGIADAMGTQITDLDKQVASSNQDPAVIADLQQRLKDIAALAIKPVA